MSIKKTNIGPFWLDGSCEYCAQALAEITNGLESGKVVIISPDFNSCGRETHKHIQIFGINSDGKILDDDDKIVPFDEIIGPFARPKKET